MKTGGDGGVLGSVHTCLGGRLLPGRERVVYKGKKTVLTLDVRDRGKSSCISHTEFIICGVLES